MGDPTDNDTGVKLEIGHELPPSAFLWLLLAHFPQGLFVRCPRLSSCPQVASSASTISFFVAVIGSVTVGESIPIPMMIISGMTIPPCPVYVEFLVRL